MNKIQYLSNTAMCKLLKKSQHARTTKKNYFILKIKGFRVPNVLSKYFLLSSCYCKMHTILRG